MTAAAASGKLPDIIDVDGPVMPGWVWAGYMAPLTVDPAKYANFLPGAVGKYNDKVYSIGLWDAAVAMVSRKSVLDENGIRIPTLDKPWTLEEFDAALVKIQASGKFEFPLDLGMAWKGEWYPYAFGPFLQSAGGDMINRDGYKTAEGTLNGEAAVKFGNWWKSVFERKLAPGTSEDPADRDAGFLAGKYAVIAPFALRGRASHWRQSPRPSRCRLFHHVERSLRRQRMRGRRRSARRHHGGAHANLASGRHASSRPGFGLARRQSAATGADNPAQAETASAANIAPTVFIRPVSAARVLENNVWRAGWRVPGLP